ncbi:hypothetical protein SAMN05216257_102118 [Meinhardsimonia xiamenensis]|uniref:Uncharacterized protein n=1 Tax=Meinhardsimonia xiamenensis TaxID=990712 RepID=A0A1G9AFN0_9RHOB|nr:hypothetical protein [Meinhardsimonia xiamenensis]PRX35404.1 hypothetical protein LV81_02001 [Meinhardsimonia xiamenensis]SDK26068.1 hypothetical protein SAMN05216257_102118 [Meinhardsimonia xiamenensis]
MLIETEDSPWMIPAPPPARRIPRLHVGKRLGRGLGVSSRIAVREMTRGYVIEQPLTIVPVTRHDVRAAWATGAAAAGLAALGWGAVQLALPEAGWSRAGLVGLHAGLVGALAGLLLTMRGTLRVEVDTLTRRIRVCRLCAVGSRVLLDRTFGPVSELVLQRRRNGMMRLCLKAGEGDRAGWQVLAVGEEDVLRGLHRRIARDFLPPEARVAAAVPSPASRRSMAFPLLGPHELRLGGRPSAG